MKNSTLILILMLIASISIAQRSSSLKKRIDQNAEEIESRIIEWRHHLHMNPELSNREFETAAFVKEHLEGLGLEVTDGVAHTGVVGILKGGRPGPVIALRADMDALPVKERVPLEWASQKTSVYNGQETGVMHACGHDTHVAILMGVAEVLAKVQDDLSGTIKFIFQPAEEGPPAGEEGGAKLMVKEGVLKNPDVDVIFGLHIWANEHTGKIRYKPGGTMAAANMFTIKVNGKQSHGSTPWQGVDPVVTSAMIINGLQTIVSRQSELTKEAVVISVGSIHGGIRNNIIPEEVTMVGTIRTLDPKMKEKVFAAIERTAVNIAESQGASAEVSISEGAEITYNDPDLTALMVPSLEEVMGSENVVLSDAITGAEDFSYFQQEVPGFFFFLGGSPTGIPLEEVYPHHTPDFFVEDKSMLNGVKAFGHLVVDYAEKSGKK